MVPAAPAKWTAPILTIDGSSLGAVKVGMTHDEAQQAAGVTFDGHGDSAFYSTTMPACDAHPFVDIDDAGHVFCVGAQTNPDAEQTQTVMTAAGFRLGDPVSKLRSVYGDRLVHVPNPQQGIAPRDGYIVTTPTGRLAFSVGSHGKVYGITAGKGFEGNPLEPSLCID